jgi:hypothetical protein
MLTIIGDGINNNEAFFRQLMKFCVVMLEFGFDSVGFFGALRK